MRFLKNSILLLGVFLLTACSQTESEYNLDELKGPAAILVETWRADGIADEDILKRIDNHMNIDGTELYYDKKSKKIIERVQKLKVEGTELSLKEFMDALYENIAWADSGPILPQDLMSQGEYPNYFSEDARLVGVSENSKNPEFKVLLYVDDKVISIYKVKSEDSEAFNEEAELALTMIYDELINKTKPENLENEQVDKESSSIKEEPVQEESHLNAVPATPSTSKLYNKYEAKIVEATQQVEELDDAFTGYTTAEINAHMDEVVNVWDGLLNDMYQALKANLPESEFATLQADQRQWIKARDAYAEQTATEEAEGGTMYTMVYLSAISDYTEQRCYDFLYDYMTGR